MDDQNHFGTSEDRQFLLSVKDMLDFAERHHVFATHDGKHFEIIGMQIEADRLIDEGVVFIHDGAGPNTLSDCKFYYSHPGNVADIIVDLINRTVESSSTHISQLKSLAKSLAKYILTRCV